MVRHVQNGMFLPEAASLPEEPSHTVAPPPAEETRPPAGEAHPEGPGSRDGVPGIYTVHTRSGIFFFQQENDDDSIMRAVPPYRVEQMRREDQLRNEAADVELVRSQPGAHLQYDHVLRVLRANGGDVVDAALQLLRQDGTLDAALLTNARRDMEHAQNYMNERNRQQDLWHRLWNQSENNEGDVASARRTLAFMASTTATMIPNRRYYTYTSARDISHSPGYGDDSHGVLFRYGNVARGGMPINLTTILRLGDPTAPPPPPTPVAENLLHSLVCEFIDSEHVASDEVPNEFMCPVTLVAMRSPRCAHDGRVYESTVLDHLVAQARFNREDFVSPVTRSTMSSVFHPCLPLMGLMERWVRSQVRSQVRAPVGECLEKQLALLLRHNEVKT